MKRKKKCDKFGWTCYDRGMKAVCQKKEKQEMEEKGIMEGIKWNKASRKG